MNFELGESCFEKFIFICIIVMLVFPWLLPNDLSLKMLMFSYIFIEDANLPRVSACLLLCFSPKAELMWCLSAVTLFYLFEILLWHLSLAYIYAVIKSHLPLYHLQMLYSKESIFFFYSLSWVSFRKSFYVNKWLGLFYFNTIQYVCNL